MSELYTYDRFAPGTMLGEWEGAIDAALQAKWDRLFGTRTTDASARTIGLTVACMMRAYLGIVSPRPPGNIHARQTLSIQGLPQDGEIVRTQVWCRDKELRKDRRYIYLEAIGTGNGGRPLYSGQMSLIWAA